MLDNVKTDSRRSHEPFVVDLRSSIDRIASISTSTLPLLLLNVNLVPHRTCISSSGTYSTCHSMSIIGYPIEVTDYYLFLIPAKETLQHSMGLRFKRLSWTSIDQRLQPPFMHLICVFRRISEYQRRRRRRPPILERRLDLARAQLQGMTRGRLDIIFPNNLSWQNSDGHVSLILKG